MLARRLIAAGILAFGLDVGAAKAHFLELIPSSDILPEGSAATVSLQLLFTHPVEGGPVMDLALPRRFGVMREGRSIDLKSGLAPIQYKGKSAFTSIFTASEPGDYIFYVEPAPYWEAAEKHFLVHYTKVVVDFAGGSGWDQPVGLPVEIIPLSRPYGLWTGNLFRGTVLKDGKPLPGATVEVEWVNDGLFKPPSDPYVTQIVKTDSAGVFAYAIPRAGWWGFNALTAGQVVGPDGKAADAELGGTIWVKAIDLK